MRCEDRFTRVGLALFLIPVFLSTALLYGVAPADAAPAKSPPPTQPAPSQSATISGADPLGVPEDPLGRQSEEQAAEISISVDVRDGHLIVRVVDIWGPRRVPLVVRSWTGEGNSPSGAGYWQLNQHLDVIGGTDADGTVIRRVLEADGNRGKYRFLQQNGTGSSRTNVYVKNVGTYSTMEAVVSCYLDSGDKGSFWVCNETGDYTVHLPKGVTRRFASSLITQEQDANGNVVTYTWTSLIEQDRVRIASVTDPVGRVTTYGYEAYNRVCVRENDRG